MSDGRGSHSIGVRMATGRHVTHEGSEIHAPDLSSEKPTTCSSDRSCAEEAARLLLASGFRPGDTIGQVEHIAYSHRSGRTLGSIWDAMRKLIRSAPEE